MSLEIDQFQPILQNLQEYAAKKGVRVILTADKSGYMNVSIYEYDDDGNAVRFHDMWHSADVHGERRHWDYYSNYFKEAVSVEE